MPETKISGNELRQNTFLVSRITSAQSIPNTAYTKIAFNNEEIDEGLIFDITNNRFVAPIGGYYALSMCINLIAMTSGKIVIAHLYKNGVDYKRLSLIQTASANDITVSGAINLKLVAGDYVEIFVYHNNGGAVNTSSDAIYTWFAGQLLF